MVIDSPSLDDLNCFNKLHFRAISTLLPHADLSPLPEPDQVRRAADTIISTLPNTGYGLARTLEHVTIGLTPGFSNSSLSANYYGFVTGSVTPAALMADNLVGVWDQNVQVHIPDQSIATIIEDRALSMLLELFHLDPEEWLTRTFTTGATASNILGLAYGREYIVNKALKLLEKEKEFSVGNDGLLKACKEADVWEINVLTTKGHSSISKAGSLLGIGRANVKEVGKSDEPLQIDLHKLEVCLATANTANIVSISCGEVNTGGFATHSVEEFRKLRDLCDKYGAWLHADGAFGLFTRALPSTPEYQCVYSGGLGLELADSIGGDGHKLLNVPYDCGFLFCRHPPSLAASVFQNPNAAYLSPNANSDSIIIPSPLNIGMENSRRFRALPVYATLMAYGREGYVEMLQRQIAFARKVAEWIREGKEYELLPGGMENIFIVVLFRAVDEESNEQLVGRINTTRKIYVSETVWEGKKAARIAVANWQVDVKRDFEVVKEALEEAVRM